MEAWQTWGRCVISESWGKVSLLLASIFSGKQKQGGEKTLEAWSRGTFEMVVAWAWESEWAKSP